MTHGRDKSYNLLGTSRKQKSLADKTVSALNQILIPIFELCQLSEPEFIELEN